MYLTTDHHMTIDVTEMPLEDLFGRLFAGRSVVRITYLRGLDDDLDDPIVRAEQERMGDYFIIRAEGDGMIVRPWYDDDDSMGVEEEMPYDEIVSVIYL